MLDKVKKCAVIIAIAILFSMLSFSIVDLVMEAPRYEDFCILKESPYRPVSENLKCPSFAEPTQFQREDCNEREGMIEYSYDKSGCPVSFECNTCGALYEEAGKQHRFIGFVITSIIGIIAIIVGMYIKSKNEVVEWVYAGILIGGIASIFLGTISYFQDMGRFVKPFVLLAEIVLIVWVAIRTSAKKKK